MTDPCWYATACSDLAVQQLLSQTGTLDLSMHILWATMSSEINATYNYHSYLLWCVLFRIKRSCYISESIEHDLQASDKKKMVKVAVICRSLGEQYPVIKVWILKPVCINLWSLDNLINIFCGDQRRLIELNSAGHKMLERPNMSWQLLWEPTWGIRMMHLAAWVLLRM